jgi:hypothetical protein
MQRFDPKIINFQCQMEQIIYIKYVNKSLAIGLVNWQEVWDIANTNPQHLYTETYKGTLVFRKRGSSKRRTRPITFFLSNTRFAVC